MKISIAFIVQYLFFVCLQSGREEIRTLGTLLEYIRFPGVHLRPLGHPSFDFMNIANVAFFIEFSKFLLSFYALIL